MTAKLSLALLDLTYLRLVAGSDTAILRELLNLFLVDAELHLRTLQEALHRGAWEEARYEAHALCGLAATTGAKRLQALARQAEDHLRDGEPHEALALLSDLLLAWDEAQKACRDEM